MVHRSVTLVASGRKYQSSSTRPIPRVLYNTRKIMLVSLDEQEQPKLSGTERINKILLQTEYVGRDP